jgi:hypothetical protein
MFLLRKWLKLPYQRTLIFGVLIVAMLACSFPITHANHPTYDHGHQHDLSVAELEDVTEKKTDQNERSSHQHVGMNEHNPAYLLHLPDGFSPNSSAERWRLAKLHSPMQDFLYEFERPPRPADFA